MDPAQVAAFDARMQQSEAALGHQMQMHNQLQTALQQQRQHHRRPDCAGDEGTTIATQRRRHQRHRQASTFRRRRGKVRHVGARPDRFHECSLATNKKRDAVVSRPDGNLRRRSRGRMDRTDKFRNVKELSAQLHGALIGLVEGEGCDLVVGVEGSCGMEAWRKLTRRYVDQVAGSSKNMLKNVLNPPHCRASVVLSGMDHWEQLCRRYTNRKGSDGKKRGLWDDILMGTLQELGAPELRTHLYLNWVGAHLHKDDPMAGKAQKGTARRLSSRTAP